MCSSNLWFHEDDDDDRIAKHPFDSRKSCEHTWVRDETQFNYLNGIDDVNIH